MDVTGSVYTGDTKNRRMEGKGEYLFPNGTRYVGDMKDGEFHGHGVLIFPSGSRFEADWVHGKAAGQDTPARGHYTFKDGLKYQEGDWEYCDEDDRRFYQEHLHGVNPAGNSRKVDKGEPNAIPDGTYDTGDGYFDPIAQQVFGYDAQPLRTPDEEEAQWIVEKCRKG